jgi:hypothetical protein
MSRMQRFRFHTASKAGAARSLEKGVLEKVSSKYIFKEQITLILTTEEEHLREFVLRFSPPPIHVLRSLQYYLIGEVVEMVYSEVSHRWRCESHIS